jgi:secreted PhoX family phosphatase
VAKHREAQTLKYTLREVIMTISRRTFIQGTAVGLAGAALAPSVLRAQEAKSMTPKIRVSSCTIGLDQAKLAGLEGVRWAWAGRRTS